MSLLESAANIERGERGEMTNEQENNSKPTGTVRVPLTVLKALGSILNFYWDEEFAHYSSISRTERKETRHIFQDLNTVRRWFLRVTASKTK